MTGASSGIGYELARQFAEHGFDLLVTAESEGIDEAAGRLRSLGAKVESVRANLADFDGVESLYERIRASGRPVDAIAGATETNFFQRAGMEGTRVGAGRKSDAADVARQGFEALMTGKDHVVAAMAKEEAMVALGKVMPETVKAEQHRKLAEPWSANA